MSTIAASSLPPPHEVAETDGAVVLAALSSQLPYPHVPDPQLQPRRWTAAWRMVAGSVADAIRRHYAEHTHGVFTLTMPRTGEVVRVSWVEGPQIQWASDAFATSVTAELEEALEYDD